MAPTTCVSSLTGVRMRESGHSPGSRALPTQVGSLQFIRGLCQVFHESLNSYIACVVKQLYNYQKYLFKCMCMIVSGNENMAGGYCSRATGGAESTAPVHHLCVHCVLHSEL